MRDPYVAIVDRVYCLRVCVQKYRAVSTAPCMRNYLFMKLSAQPCMHAM